MKAADTVLASLGRVDILVNNAGIVSGMPLLKLSEKQIRATFEVNVISHFWTLQAFLPQMLSHRSGHIVTIASTAGRTGVSHLTDYCASKFAARGLEMSLRRELIDLGKIKGIKLTCVNPYFINTGMFDGAESRSNLMNYIIGCVYLEQNYVAHQIYEAIRYEKREITLSKRLGWVLDCEHILPWWAQDHATVSCCNMRKFKGRH